MMISVSDREENIVGKGENAVHQHFLLFQQCFQIQRFLLQVHEKQRLFKKMLNCPLQMY